MVHHTECPRACTQHSAREAARRAGPSAYLSLPSTYPADRHLVGGERAGLVRADHRRAAERLDRRQTAHDRVLLRHAPSAERQARRDDGR